MSGADGGDRQRRLATTATVVAVVLWAAGSTLAKKVRLPGEVLSLHRVAWAAVLYAGAGALRRQWITRPRLRTAAWAGVCYALTNVLFFLGVKSTTVANANSATAAWSNG